MGGGMGGSRDDLDVGVVAKKVEGRARGLTRTSSLGGGVVGGMSIGGDGYMIRGGGGGGVGGDGYLLRGGGGGDGYILRGGGGGGGGVGGDGYLVMRRGGGYDDVWDMRQRRSPFWATSEDDDEGESSEEESSEESSSEEEESDDERGKEAETPVLSTWTKRFQVCFFLSFFLFLFFTSPLLLLGLYEHFIFN